MDNLIEFPEHLWTSNSYKEGAPLREALYDCLTECEEKLLDLGEEHSEDPSSVLDMACTVFEILAKAAKSEK